METLLHGFRLAANACGTRTGILPSLYDDPTNRLTCADGVPHIKSISDILIVVGNAAKILIMISGALAVITIIVAAIYYIVSAGDPGRVKKAKDILMNTIFGLIIIIASYAIVTFIAAGFD